MLKRFAQRIGLNFKHSKSDRAGTNSYRNYHGRIKKIITNFNPVNKIKQYYIKGKKV